nr:plasmid recombination protein [Bacillus velezensis]
MSYAVCRMQKVKSAGLKGMQFHNQRERKSRTNDDIDHERTRENYDLKNDKNIDYNERVKEIIESQKTGTRKTRKDAVLVNELLVTSDRDFFEQLQFSFGMGAFKRKTVARNRGRRSGGKRERNRTRGH